MKFGDRVRKLLGLDYIDAHTWEDLFDLLVEGDLGPALADALVSELRLECGRQNAHTGDIARLLLAQIIRRFLTTKTMSLEKGKLSVIVLLGVNGVGKTTTLAKLANYYRLHEKPENIILAAGDTFRAAAIDQLKTHGQRLDMKVVAQSHGSDAGAVIYDAIESAIASKSELVLADTAGRMHTKQNLILELKKIDKIVLSKIGGGQYQKLLVLDATTGANALRQAETFSEAVKIDGIVLTKYDSSARGGIIATINKQLGIPTVFIGTGEGYGDIAPFDCDEYLKDLLGL